MSVATLIPASGRPAAAAVQPQPALDALLADYAAAWNARDIDAIMACHCSDTEYELHGTGQRQRGAAAVRAQFAASIAAMPDMHFELRSAHCREALLLFETTITGTLQGKKARLEAVDILTLRGLKVFTKDTYTVQAGS